MEFYGKVNPSLIFAIVPVPQRVNMFFFFVNMLFDMSMNQSFSWLAAQK